MNYFNEALRVSNALVRYVCILARKVDVIFLVFVFLCVFGIKPTYAQTLEQVYYPSVSTNITIGNTKIKYKTALFIKFDSEEKPDIYHFQNALSLGLYKSKKIKIDGSLLYRRYNVFDENTTNEFRPAQTIKITGLFKALVIENSLKFEQRFRETYSNRWIYKIQFGGMNKTFNFLPTKINNEFLYSFNSTSTGYENRFLVELANSVLNQPVSISIQHRMKNIFTDKDLKHLLILKTDISLP
jgi:hypothetical protein